MFDKAASRLIRAQIRNVLLTVWDPIGAQHEANAQDEYDGYVGGIYELLVTGATDMQLNDYLLGIVHDQMGLDAATTERMVPTIEALRKISF